MKHSIIRAVGLASMVGIIAACEPARPGICDRPDAVGYRVNCDDSAAPATSPKPKPRRKPAVVEPGTPVVPDTPADDPIKPTDKPKRPNNGKGNGGGDGVPGKSPHGDGDR